MWFQCPSSFQKANNANFTDHSHLIEPIFITTGTMISDDDLYKLAIALGSAAMVAIVGYHYVEVNAEKDIIEDTTSTKGGKQAAALK